ncbi:MAG: lamin tail domain-containing protein, partial [Thermoplasmata archaeon]
MVRDFTLLSKVVSIGAFSSFIFSSFLVIVSLQSQEAVALAPPWGDAMEAGPGMWKNYSNGKGAEWQWGAPQNVGPNSTHSGQNAWGTNIDSNYSAEALAHLESPHFDLTLSTNTKLTFWHYLATNDFLTHDWDGGIIEVSTDGGNTWVQIDDEATPNPNPYYDATLRDTRGNPLGGKKAYCYDRLNWTEVSVDLSQYDEFSSFKFRFTFGSDMVGDFPGWYVDDVILSADTREGVLVEPDYLKIDRSGTTHQFNLTVRNLQKMSEIVDIPVSDTFGWPVELFKWDGVSPLVDSGGLAGVPDSGLLFRGSSLNFVLKVTIPVGTPYATRNIILVEGIPFYGSVPSDNAHIRVSTPSPDVSITDFLVPNVHVSGELADVTALIRNLGDFPRSFDVRLDIHGPGKVSHNAQKTVEDLDVDDTANVSWTFTPTVPGDYALSVVTLLEGDVVQDNNVSTREMEVMNMLFEDDMESGGPASQGLWTPETRPQNAWKLGIPTTVGPSSCYSLDKCWGTNLNSEYKKGADIRLETPLMDLSKTDEAWLGFWHFYDIHGPDGNDGGFVEISNDGGSSWTYVEPMGGYPGNVDFSAPTPPGGGSGAYAGSNLGWELAEFNLSQYSGQQIIIGFHLWTDYSNYQSGWAGWYIDDVQVLHVPVGSTLIFTEIQDDGMGGERIEVYNAGKESDNLNNYAISRDGGITRISGAWSVPQIDPGKHSFFTTTGNELNDDGDLLYLVNTSSNWIERQISYGQRGVVPDPISGESSSRFWSGTEYQDYWTRSLDTSFGFRNNVPPWKAQTEVVLNEVLFNPQNAGEEFVEIYYTGNASVNITGFVVVCDNAYTIVEDVILNPPQNHYVLLPSDFPELFTEMDVSGENLYLYNSTGSFVDMVGWSSRHGTGKSVARVPEGFGSREGYDDSSSHQAGWRFAQEPTMALISIWPDQTGDGDLGDSISYAVTLLNQPADDLISLTVDTSQPWQVEFFSDSLSPLTDTNSDGLIDTGVLPASSFFNFTVTITIPTQPPIGNEMVAEVCANSSTNRAKDFTTLVTRTFPHLEPMKSAYPEEIYLEGVGTNEVTEITLEVFGGGYAFTERQPQDTIFIIDSSGSMETSDPSNLRLEATKKYVDSMREPDRGAVVDFDSTAGLAPKGSGDHLSSDYAKIKQNIDSIDSRGGTDVGAGLEVANSELIGYGNPSRLWIEILLTDGNEPDIYYPSTSMQVQNATDAGIMIFTIGLGPDANTDLLGEIANRTGGEYYHAENAEALEEIYSKIELVVFDIAGRDSDLTDANRMIRDVIPSYIHIIYSSFSIHPDVIYSDMGVTVFEWNVARIRVNE